MSSNVRITHGLVSDLVPDTTTIITGDWKYKDTPNTTIQAILNGTGALSATIVIEGTNDDKLTVGVLLGTITLNGTTQVTDGFTTNAAWKRIRANVTAISGTGATVSVKACG